jgi:hypothetical protein
MPSKVRILDPPHQQERPLTSINMVRGRSSSSPAAAGAVWWSTGGSALYGPTFERGLIEDHVICSVKVAGVWITVSVPAVMGSAVLLGLLVSPMSMVWAARAASMSVTESPTNVAAAGVDQVRVRSCAAGVGWAVVMASTSWAVKAALTYLGRASSAVATCRAGTHWPGAGGWACSSSASCDHVGSGCSATTEVRTLTGATGYQVGCSSRSVPDREVRVIPALVAVRLRDRPCAPARGDRAARVGVDGQGYRSHLSDRRSSPASA